MAAKMVSLRLDPDLLEWADSYAKKRKSTRTSIVDAALREFREARAGGVPELPERKRPAKPRVEKALKVPGVVRASQLPMVRARRHLPTCKCSVCKPGVRGS